MSDMQVLACYCAKHFIRENRKISVHAVQIGLFTRLAAIKHIQKVSCRAKQQSFDLCFNIYMYLNLCSIGLWHIHFAAQFVMRNTTCDNVGDLNGLFFFFSSLLLIIIQWINHSVCQCACIWLSGRIQPCAPRLLRTRKITERNNRRIEAF